MKIRQIFFAAATILLFAAGIFSAAAQSNAVTTAPVYVPDMTHASDPLPDGVFNWDSLNKETNAAADQENAHITFSTSQMFPAATSPFLSAKGSCSCTVAGIAAAAVDDLRSSGTSGRIGATVNIARQKLASSRNPSTS